MIHNLFYMYVILWMTVPEGEQLRLLESWGISLRPHVHQPNLELPEPCEV